MVSKIPTVQNSCKAERRISRNPSTLIYCMGTEAVQIYKSMSFKKKEDEKEFRRHIKQIWRLFHTEKNVIHEDAKFYLRTRRDVEPIEKFVRGLYELAENCDFPQKNDKIRDHFVIGLKSKELSEKLQLSEDLSLEKAVEIVRSNEQVKMQMGEMQDNSMDAITKEKKETTKHTGWEKYPQKAANTLRCKKWNKYHKFNKCPAKGKICRNCDKMNPFAIWCRSLTKNTELRKQPTERYFLGSICKNELPEKKKKHSLHVKLMVGEIPIIFKIDTGVDINVISTKTFRKLRKRPMLKPPHDIYKSPGDTLTCEGKFWVNTTHKNKTLHNNTDNSLSWDTAYKMGLVTVVANVNRCIKGEPVKITLRENVVPYCTPTARRIPFPILPKVKKGASTLRRRRHYTKSYKANGLVFTHCSNKKKMKMSGYA